MIGIFDSGIGGLTVVRELLVKAPDAGFIYLGDTARTPYGNKTPDVLKTYACEDAAFLVSQGATSIVIACNSVSATAVDAVRAAHLDLRVYEVITPAVEDALRATADATRLMREQGEQGRDRGGRVGVIGTRATINSGVYQSLLSRQKDLFISALACPLFVPLVEEGFLKDEITDAVIARYLEPLKKQEIDTLILGCTHYPLLKDRIGAFMGPSVQLVDSAEEVVGQLIADGVIQQSDNQITRGEQTYFLTDVGAHSQSVAEKWLDRSLLIHKAVL